MRARFKELMAIGGFLLLGALAVASWTRHDAQPQAIRKSSEPQREGQPIKALSNGTAGFLK